MKTPWVVTWLGAAVLTANHMLNLDLPYTYEAAIFVAGVFTGAEWSAVIDGVSGNTKSEGVWDNVRHPMVRWGLGIWLAWVVGTYLSGWLALPLALWLPLHFAVEGIERRLLNR